MRSYNESVKRKYGPVVSRTKRQEVERRKKSLEVPPREKYRPKNDVFSDQEKKRKIYLERMDYYNKQAMKKKKQSSTPSIIKTQEQIDYLREFRNNRNSSQEKVTRDRGKLLLVILIIKNFKLDWEADINQPDMDDIAKNQRVNK